MQAAKRNYAEMSFHLSALQKGCELTLSVLMSTSYVNIVDW